MAENGASYRTSSTRSSASCETRQTILHHGVSWSRATLDVEPVPGKDTLYDNSIPVTPWDGETALAGHDDGTSESPRPCPSRTQLSVHRVSAQAVGRNVCCTTPASTQNSPEALDIPHVQDGVGVPWTQTHTLVGHIVHFHVASATGCAHEEPAWGTTKRLVSCQACHGGKLVPTTRGTGQASPPRRLLDVPSLQPHHKPPWSSARPRQLGLCLGSSKLPPPARKHT